MEQDKSFLDMSLDEYIAKMGQDIDSSSRSSINRNDDKFERKNKNYHEEEDEDILLKSDCEEDKEEAESETWKGPEASAAAMVCHDQQIDLREKLNSINNNQSRVSTNKVHVVHPNNNTDTATDIPPLLSKNVSDHSQQRNICYDKKRYNRNRNRNRNRNQGFNNHSNRQNFRDMNYINYNRNGPNDANNRGFHRDRNQDLSRNLNGVQTKNITIQIPSSYVHLKPGGPIGSCFQVPKNEENRSMPIGGITPQAQAVLDLETSHKPESNTNNGNLKSLLGFQGNVSEEMMPLFAARLLEFVQKGVQANIHKPMYDMKLQKEIHEIQNKPLLYKCNGGQVISSDGAGVNCKINPSTSGVSLNCRFA